MPAPTADDFFHVLRALFPMGAAWDMLDNPDTTFSQFVRGLAIEPARLNARSLELLEEADPRTTTQLIDDWERVMGLPDNCGDAPETLQERRDLVVTKLNAVGGQSRQYYIDLAAVYGITITIDEFFPFRCGRSGCGDGLNGGDWPWTWQVNAAATKTVYFRCGASQCGDQFLLITNEQLECLINKYKPAHTEVIFNYA
ncbi:MAG TPA: putative phage tail protein [Prosthecobacter sp.]|nr:putative phage tail protein [Prosthecobacter sp.]